MTIKIKNDDGWDKNWKIEEFYTWKGSPSKCEIYLNPNSVDQFIGKSFEVSIGIGKIILDKF